MLRVNGMTISKPNALIIVDANFLIALLFEKENSERKARALDIFKDIKNKRIIIPWPVMFETLIDKNIKKKEALISFENLLKKIKLKYFYDKQYRQEALHKTFKYNTDPNLRPKDKRVSLTDMIIRSIIEDSGVKKDALVSFNAEDFSDVCYKNRIELIN
jgi:predicted nucleic acid-binding protein